MESIDMCVDYDILCDVQDKLKKIEYDLANSTNQMENAIVSSQNFLSGNQFEKAKRATDACVSVVRTTEINIRNAMDFLEKLKESLEEYGQCSYKGDA